MNIVPTNVNYTYSLLRRNLIELNSTFPFLNVQVIGNSVLGKNIYAVKLGKGPNKVCYSGTFHANEWIVSVVLMKFIEDYCDAYVNKASLYNQYIPDLFNSASIFIVPMVNPDGADLVTGNIFTSSYAYERALGIASGFPEISFPSGWKANINGVDFKNYQTICKNM